MKKYIMLIALFAVVLFGMSSCVCTYPYYYDTSYARGVAARNLREADNALWQAQQRLNTARQAIDNERWQAAHRGY